MPKKERKLHPDIIHQLLNDIEISGGLDIANCKTLCDFREDLYGGKSSDRRTQVKNIFYYWKRLSPSAFENVKKKYLSLEQYLPESILPDHIIPVTAVDTMPTPPRIKMMTNSRATTPRHDRFPSIPRSSYEMIEVNLENGGYGEVEVHAFSDIVHKGHVVNGYEISVQADYRDIMADMYKAYLTEENEILLQVAAKPYMMRNTTDASYDMIKLKNKFCARTKQSHDLKKRQMLDDTSLVSKVLCVTFTTGEEFTSFTDVNAYGKMKIFDTWVVRSKFVHEIKHEVTQAVAFSEEFHFTECRVSWKICIVEDVPRKIELNAEDNDGMSQLTANFKRVGLAMAEPICATSSTNFPSPTFAPTSSVVNCTGNPFATPNRPTQAIRSPSVALEPLPSPFRSMPSVAMEFTTPRATAFVAATKSNAKSTFPTKKYTPAKMLSNQFHQAGKATNSVIEGGDADFTKIRSDAARVLEWADNWSNRSSIQPMDHVEKSPATDFVQLDPSLHTAQLDDGMDDVANEEDVATPNSEQVSIGGGVTGDKPSPDDDNLLGVIDELYDVLSNVIKESNDSDFGVASAGPVPSTCGRIVEELPSEVDKRMGTVSSSENHAIASTSHADPPAVANSVAPSKNPVVAPSVASVLVAPLHPPFTAPPTKDYKKKYSPTKTKYSRRRATRTFAASKEANQLDHQMDIATNEVEVATPDFVLLDQKTQAALPVASAVSAAQLEFEMDVVTNEVEVVTPNSGPNQVVVNVMNLVNVINVNVLGTSQFPYTTNANGPICGPAIEELPPHDDSVPLGVNNKSLPSTKSTCGAAQTFDDDADNDVPLEDIDDVPLDDDVPLEVIDEPPTCDPPTSNDDVPLEVIDELPTSDDNDFPLEVIDEPPTSDDNDFPLEFIDEPPTSDDNDFPLEFTDSPPPDNECGGRFQSGLIAPPRKACKKNSPTKNDEPPTSDNSDVPLEFIDKPPPDDDDGGGRFQSGLIAPTRKACKKNSPTKNDEPPTSDDNDFPLEFIDKPPPDDDDSGGRFQSGLIAPPRKACKKNSPTKKQYNRRRGTKTLTAFKEKRTSMQSMDTTPETEKAFNDSVAPVKYPVVAPSTAGVVRRSRSRGIAIGNPLTPQKRLFSSSVQANDEECTPSKIPKIVSTMNLRSKTKIPASKEEIKKAVQRKGRADALLQHKKNRNLSNKSSEVGHESQFM